MKKKLAVLASVLGILIGGLSIATAAHATQWSTWELSSTTGVGTAFCVDNTNGSSNNGNHQQLWNCAGSAHDGYSTGSSTYGDGHWKEILVQGGKCLSGQSGSDNTAVILWDCNGSSSQAVCWRENSAGVEYWVFENGEAIDDHNDVAADGNAIVDWAYNGDNAQSWYGPTAGPAGDNCSSV